MTLEDMIIAHELIRTLHEKNMHYLLDLLEGSPDLVPLSSMEALHKFQAQVEFAFGCDHPASEQLQRILLL